MASNDEGRTYAEVTLPGARNTTRVLVDPGTGADVSQVPVGAFAQVEAQRTEAAAAAAEYEGSQSDREYEDIRLPGSSRTTRVLKRVGDAEMDGGAYRMASGVETVNQSALGEDREYATVTLPGSARETRILVSTGGQERNELTDRLVEGLDTAAAVAAEREQGISANAYTSTAGNQPEGVVTGTEGSVEIYDSPEAAASAAKAEAEAAGITNVDAVMHSAQDGYGTGSGNESAAPVEAQAEEDTTQVEDDAPTRRRRSRAAEASE